MPREARLFEESGGSPLRAYLLMKANGNGGIPPNWVSRARKSRRKRQTDVTKALKKGTVRDILTLEDWELSYRKETFYQGIRILFALEKNPKSKL